MPVPTAAECTYQCNCETSARTAPSLVSTKDVGVSSLLPRSTPRFFSSSLYISTRSGPSACALPSGPPSLPAPFPCVKESCQPVCRMVGQHDALPSHLCHYRLGKHKCAPTASRKNTSNRSSRQNPASHRESLNETAAIPRRARPSLPPVRAHPAQSNRSLPSSRYHNQSLERLVAPCVHGAPSMGLFACLIPMSCGFENRT